jgi:hypothetical protein
VRHLQLDRVVCLQPHVDQFRSGHPPPAIGLAGPSVVACYSAWVRHWS